jgi:outer membrane protein assembly factor BamB
MRRFPGIVCSAAVILTVLALPAGANTATRAGSAATTFVNWPAYLLGPTHPSFNSAAGAITPAKVASLTRVWRWTPAAPTMAGQPGTELFASPTVFNGRIYIGANTGVFYALDEATGQVLWHRFMGFVTAKTCAARGFNSTATVAPDPVSGALTVYVTAADGYLYALNAANGALKWRSAVAIPSTTVNDYYNWSSPTVVNGRIYMGVSSECDSPLVMGGLKAYDQATGKLLAFYKTNPGGSTGPSIWSSAAARPTSPYVYVTTGNGAGSDAISVVQLDAATLKKLSSWQVPSSEHGGDSDFGGSPTFFPATLAGVYTPLLGACNKNGVYYALRRGNLAAGPVWRFKAGSPQTGGGAQCDAAAVWNGAHLFVAGNATVIGGITYKGSVRMLNPATGSPLWQRGLASTVTGSPTLSGGGVLAAPTYGSAGLYLINAATGGILRQIFSGQEFGQPVFSDNMLLVPTRNNGLWAYR